MRGRLLAVVIVLIIAIAVIWELRRMAPQPPVTPPSAPAPLPPVPPPIVHEIVPTPPPLPVKKPKPKKQVKPLTKLAAPKKVAAPPVPPVTMPPVQIPPAVPVIPPAPPPSEQQEWVGNTDSAITHEGQIVILNDHQWIRFWSEHHPHEAAPDVDFSNNMVVGVFLGQRPSDGFATQITGVHVQPNAVEVDYIERAPPPGTFQIGVTAFPYDIKVIPRSTLHVKFNKVAAVYKPQVFPPKSKP